MGKPDLFAACDRAAGNAYGNLRCSWISVSPFAQGNRRDVDGTDGSKERRKLPPFPFSSAGQQRSRRGKTQRDTCYTAATSVAMFRSVADSCDGCRCAQKDNNRPARQPLDTPPLLPLSRAARNHGAREATPAVPPVTASAPPPATPVPVRQAGCEGRPGPVPAGRIRAR